MAGAGEGAGPRPIALSGGVPALVFAEIGSTNEEARLRAEAGERGPLWLRADRQTAGRGRRGRAWDGPAGNLMASLLFAPPMPPAEAALYSFAAALAVAETLDAVLPPERVRLKWPNDVLVLGAEGTPRKIAGILLESASAAGRTAAPWLVVGIGVNLASHPQGTEFPATSAVAEGAEAPPPDEALDRLAARFAHWDALYRGQGFEPLRRAWLGRAHGLGGPIEARLASETHRGVFEGLDADGALRLRLPGGVRQVTAGELFFG